MGQREWGERDRGRYMRVCEKEGRTDRGRRKRGRDGGEKDGQRKRKRQRVGKK